jgi:alkylation response protein AidB-like acyl-CoA dehydrogenase
MIGAATQTNPTALLDAARDVAAELATRADQHDREGSYAPENIDALWAAGLGNLTLPGDLGGAGAGLATSAEAVRIVATGDASTALIWVMHLIHLRMLSDPTSGLPVAVRDRVVASSLAGPALINALRVEPELGTPGRGGVPGTRAVRATGPDGEPQWRITGHKIYSTGSHGLRWLLVWAATGDEDPDGVRIGPFLVPADAPGIEIRETWDHLGMRASASHDILLHDTPVPLDHAGALEPLGSPILGLRDPVSMGWMNLLLLGIYQGVAGAARDWLVGYLHERVPSNLGAPLASLPRFQVAVGEIDALLLANRRLLDALAQDIDAGGEAARRAGRESSLAKVVVTRNVIAATEQAVALVGNPGLAMHHPLQRHLRDALCSRIHAPQDDVVLTAAGRAALGLEPPSKGT